MAYCTYNHQRYSPGSLICDVNVEKSCQDDGTFQFHSKICGDTANCQPSQENIVLPNETGESCYYGGQEYGHFSTICQNGGLMKCDNGKWYGAGVRNEDEQQS